MNTNLTMKTSVRLAAAMLALLCLVSSAFAASQTWTNAPVSGSWTNVLNWNAKAVPGAVNGTGNGANADTAFFTNALSGGIGGAANPIVPDDGTINGDRSRAVLGVTFDGPNCGAYVFSSPSPAVLATAGNPATGILYVGHNGALRMNAPVNNNQTFLIPLYVLLPSSTLGVFNLINNSTNGGGLLISYLQHGGATSRATVFVLDGTNSSANNIVTNLSEGAGNATGGITKQGTGTWIIAGPGTFPFGSSANINSGTLQVNDAGAFGLVAAPNINGNGVLLVNGVNLNQLNVNLNQNGTYRQNGSGTVNKITIGTNAVSNPTLATTGSGDVLSVAALSGGAVDGTIHVAGPGTVQFQSDATVTNGGWSFDAGIAQMGTGNSLGVAPKTLTFGASSTGKLQLNANSIISLALTSNPTAGTPVVENGGAGTSVLTVSNVVANTFAGVLQNGTGGGTLGLSKYNIGTLTLSGVNTYTGNTTINIGTVNLNGSLGASAVTVALGGTLAGTGTAGGLVDVLNGGILSPGNSGVGTLNVSSLTLEASSIVNLQPGNDLANVTASGGLTLNGGVIYLYQSGGVSAFSTPGTYNLFSYTGTLNGSLANLSMGNAQGGYTYVFTAVGGNVKVTIAAALTSVLATWTNSADANWSTGANWTGGTAPHAGGDAATLGVSTGLRTITLNVPETVATLNFTNPNSFIVTGANTLSLDNSNSTANINVSGGTANAISSQLALNDNTSVTVNSGDSLAISGVIANGINGSKTLTVGGSGTLSLTANNTYGPVAGTTVGTTLSGGATVKLGNANALSAGDVSMTVSGTLQANAAGMIVTNNLAVGTLATATVDNNANNLTLNGVISGNGGLTKTGNGTLTLGSANTYNGPTAVTAGTLAISADTSLGTAPGGDTPNAIVLNGGMLLATNSTILSSVRDIGIGAATGTVGTNAWVDASALQTLTIPSIIASAGNSGVNGLTVNQGTGHTGTVILGAANSFNGPTYIAQGVLDLQNSLALQNSSVDYTNGTLQFDGITAATFAELVGTQNLALTNLTGVGVALTLGGDNASVTYPANFTDTGATSGAGALVKAGTGTLTLAGTNTFGGDFRALTGVLAILTNGVTVANSVSVQGSSNPQLQVNGGLLFATNLSVGSSSSVGPGNMFINAGSASFAGTVSINAAGSQQSTSCGITVNTNAAFYANILNEGRGGNTQTTQQGAGTAGQGLIVSGGTVVITNNMAMGNVAAANSGSSSMVSGGSLTIGGSLTFGCNNGGRWSIFDVSGGTVVVNDTVVGIQIGGLYPSAGQVLLVRGGTVLANIITLGNVGSSTTNNTGSSVINVTGGALYLGSGGIVQVSSNATPVVSLNGGILGASADWTWTNGVTLGGGTIQTADTNGNPHNITLTGVIGGTGLTNAGTGTLTLASIGNGFTGGAMLNAGTLNINSTWQLGGAVYGGLTFNGGTLQYAATPMNGALDITHDTAIDGTNGAVKPVTFAGAAIIDVNGNSVTCSNDVGNAGSGGLVVKSTIGGGKLKLQTNSYTGNTTVNNGATLELAHAMLPANSTVTVNTGGVLQLDFAGANVVTNIVLGGVTYNTPGTYNNANHGTFITGSGSLVIVASGPGQFTIAPGVTGITLNGANAVLTGTGGQSGDAYYLLRGTNLARPFNTWRTVATNVLGASGAFTFIGTNVVTAGSDQQFYILSNTNFNPL